MPLPRLVPDPRAALALVDSLARGAVANARSGAAAISEQITDRGQLAPAEEPTGPGSLTRIPRAECMTLLASRSVGRLAYVPRPDVPDIVPVNYVVHEGRVLVRSGVGPKLQAAERGDVLAVEADDIDETHHRGWSVVVVGPAERLTGRQISALPDGVLPHTWANGPRFAILQIKPTRVEGRRLT